MTISPQALAFSGLTALSVLDAGCSTTTQTGHPGLNLSCDTIATIPLSATNLVGSGDSVTLEPSAQNEWRTLLELHTPRHVTIRFSPSLPEAEASSRLGGIGDFLLGRGIDFYSRTRIPTTLHPYNYAPRTNGADRCLTVYVQ